MLPERLAKANRQITIADLILAVSFGEIGILNGGVRYPKPILITSVLESALNPALRVSKICAWLKNM